MNTRHLTSDPAGWRLENSYASLPVVYHFATADAGCALDPVGCANGGLAPSTCLYGKHEIDYLRLDSLRRSFDLADDALSENGHVGHARIGCAQLPEFLGGGRQRRMLHELPHDVRLAFISP